MGFLKYLIITLFFIQYYFTLTITTTINIIKYILFKFAKKQDKIYLHPHDAAHQHVFATVQQAISHSGFDIECHTFPTADGKSVALWRIRSLTKQVQKTYPVLMMHGLLDCAASWLLQENKNTSLPYMLAQRGYDVWVGNNRGNRLSQTDDTHDDDYWDYNLDHLVKYDQPALIEGVLTQTKKEKIIYVGHSQGSTQFLLSLGEHTHLKDKIAAFMGFGTVVSLEHVKSHMILEILSRLYLLQFCTWIGFKKILVIPQILSKAVGVLAYNSSLHNKIIMTFVRLLCGQTLINKIPSDMFGVIITHLPGGASTNNTLQWVQCYRKGKMHKFDYGDVANKLQYGSLTPPHYETSHLKDLPFNSYLFRGLKDAVVTPQDFKCLTDSFNPSKIDVHQLQDYNHLDYMWSETAHKDVYNKILQILQKEQQIK